MNTRIASSLLAALLTFAVMADSHAQGTAFTYQGRLTSGTSPASGSYDFQFTLFGAESGGNPVEDPVTASAVVVTNGLFTVPLDFGPNVFTGEDRWLDIAVRPAGSGSFTPLLPRQPITAAPYALTALTALNVPGVDGHSLNGAAGGPANAVFVNNSGSVGIGTANPVTRLHVTSDPGENAPPRIESSGTSGFAAGWDFHQGTVGKGYVGVPDLGATIAPGELLLYGGPGTRASLWGGGIRALTADTVGNVGIGTVFPLSRLDVRGDIRFGPIGQFEPVASLESLRIIRGRVGAFGNVIFTGTGFQVFHELEFTPYRIVFSPPFAAPPVVTATIERSLHNGFVVVSDVTRDSVTLTCYAGGGAIMPSNFSFIAIGSR